MSTDDQQFAVQVRTHIPASEYRRLAGLASEHGVTVGQLVAELVKRSLRPAKRPYKSRVDPVKSAERRAQLRELHAEGMPDPLIGKVIGMSTGWVQKNRTDMGLFANARGRLTDQQIIELADKRREASA
jgi:hypothetical protein